MSCGSKADLVDSFKEAIEACLAQLGVGEGVGEVSVTPNAEGEGGGVGTSTLTVDGIVVKDDIACGPHPLVEITPNAEGEGGGVGTSTLTVDGVTLKDDIACGAPLTQHNFVTTSESGEVILPDGSTASAIDGNGDPIPPGVGVLNIVDVNGTYLGSKVCDVGTQHEFATVNESGNITDLSGNELAAVDGNGDPVSPGADVLNIYDADGSYLGSKICTPEILCKDIPDDTFGDLCEPTDAEVEAFHTGGACFYRNETTGASWFIGSDGKACCVKPPQLTCCPAWVAQPVSTMAFNTNGDWERNGPDANNAYTWTFLPTGDVFYANATVVSSDGPAVAPFPNTGFDLGVMTIFMVGYEFDTLGYEMRLQKKGTRKRSGCAVEKVLSSQSTNDITASSTANEVTALSTTDTNGSLFQGYNNYVQDPITGLGSGFNGVWVGSTQSNTDQNGGLPAQGFGTVHYDACQGDGFEAQVFWPDNADGTNNGEVHQWDIRVRRYLPFDEIKGPTGAVLKVLDCEGEDVTDSVTITHREEDFPPALDFA